MQQKILINLKMGKGYSLMQKMSSTGKAIEVICAGQRIFVYRVR
jgi:hypothetical protein